VQSSSQIITTNKTTPSFLQTGYSSCRPTNSVRVLKGRPNHYYLFIIESYRKYTQKTEEKKEEKNH